VLLLLLSGCGVRTDLSYDELVEEHRDEHGPFNDCGFDSATCEDGAGPSAACLANAVSRCSPAEHVFFDVDGETATTFVTPTADGCEIIVLRDFGRGSVGTDFQRERCEAVEITDVQPCINFLRCDVERRWNQRR
jgi:hypothetical protein